jgi:hypothetical protein
VARFPGIPGEVALEDATVRQLAVAVCAATAGPTGGHPASTNRSESRCPPHSSPSHGGDGGLCGRESGRRCCHP